MLNVLKLTCRWLIFTYIYVNFWEQMYNVAEFKTLKKKLY